MTRNLTSLSAALLGACALFAASGASADLTLLGRSSVAALGGFTAGQEALMIKQKMMRRDVLDRGRAYSYLFDFTTRRITVIDHGLRQAEVHQIEDGKSASSKAAKVGYKLDLDKTGRQHAVKHWQCVEYTLQASMPAEIGGEKATFQLAGSVWLAKDTPEQKEMETFRAAASTPEFLVGLPAVAKITEDQALGVGETIRRLANMGTLCAFDVQTRYDGGGRMATLSQKVPTRLSLTYDNFRTDSLDANAFSIPAGYQTVNKVWSASGTKDVKDAKDNKHAGDEAVAAKAAEAASEKDADKPADKAAEQAAEKAAEASASAKAKAPAKKPATTKVK
jgi:hypothetical protein